MARLPAGPKEPQNLQSKLRSLRGTKVVPAHPEAKRNSARLVPPPKPVQPLSAPYLTCGSGDARLEHASTQSGHNRIRFDAERTQPKGEPPSPAAHATRELYLPAPGQSLAMLPLIWTGSLANSATYSGFPSSRHTLSEQIDMISRFSCLAFKMLKDKKARTS
jgi:hypothetical protein